jgi:hypothetical protein
MRDLTCCESPRHLEGPLQRNRQDQEAGYRPAKVFAKFLVLDIVSHGTPWRSPASGRPWPIVGCNSMLDGAAANHGLAPRESPRSASISLIVRLA